MLSKSVVMLLLAFVNKTNSQSSGPSGQGSTGGGGPNNGGFDSYNYDTIAYSSGPALPQGFRDGYRPSGYANQVVNSGPGGGPGYNYGYYNYYNRYGENGPVRQHTGPYGHYGPHPYPYPPQQSAQGAQVPPQGGQVPPPQANPALLKDSLFLAKLFPVKIGLFALAKIFLKILFFKKMIKFILILGLLFILPAISSNLANGFSRVPSGYPIGSFEQGFFRSLKNSKTDKDMMRELKSFVKLSIQAFREKKKCSKDSEDFSCHFENMLNAIDKNYPFSKMSSLFLDNEKPSEMPPEDATKKETN